MAEIITYRPNSIQVTATQTTDNNGQSFLASVNTLPNWDRFILFGVVDSPSGIVQNAGVRIHQLATNSDALTDANLIATVFTDAEGEYGVSLTTLTAPAVYALEVFSPGN